MTSYKITKFDETRNHLTVEFKLEDETREVRFDANHLPDDHKELDVYMRQWIEAYMAGKAAQPANDYVGLVGKANKVG